MKHFEKIFKALANKRRLAVISFLKSRREATVGEIADAIKLSFNATSKHLKILYDAEILEKDQRSLEVYYSMSRQLSPLLKSISSEL